jgi:hypothetical protein
LARDDEFSGASPIPIEFHQNPFNDSVSVVEPGELVVNLEDSAALRLSTALLSGWDPVLKG